MEVDAWRRKHLALGASAYQIDLVPIADHAQGVRVNEELLACTGKEVGPRKANEVEPMILQLRTYSAEGFDVHVTPIDCEYDFMVFNSNSLSSGAWLAKRGYAPCLVQSIGRDLQQTVLKVRRQRRDDVSLVAAEFAKRLDAEPGAPKFVMSTRSLMMAGFSSRQPDRVNSGVRIVLAESQVCSLAERKLLELCLWAPPELTRGPPGLEQMPFAGERQLTAVTHPHQPGELSFGASDEQMDAFRRAAAAVRVWLEAQGISPDADDVDYRAAIAMLESGWTAQEVQEGMLAGSDALIERHQNPGEHVWLTIQEAGSELALRAGERSAARPANG